MKTLSNQIEIEFRNDVGLR